MTPLLRLYPETITLDDALPPALDPTDTMELLGKGDVVFWDFSACAEPRQGEIVEVKPNLDYVLIKFQFGALRWCHIDEVKLILKANVFASTTQERKTPMLRSMSAS